jgi:hypothetical protein
MRSKWAVLTAGLILLSAVAAGSAFGAEPVKGKVMIYSSIYLHIIEQLKPVLKKTFPELGKGDREARGGIRSGQHHGGPDHDRRSCLLQHPEARRAAPAVQIA